MNSDAHAPLKTISTLWTVVGLFLFFVTLTTWAHTQGSNIKSPGDLFTDFGKKAVVLFAIPFCSVLIGVTSWLAENHAKASAGATWAARFPRAFRAELDVDVESSVGKWYQRVFCFAFTIFPLGGMVHFMRRFLNQRITTWDGKGSYSIWNPDWSNAFSGLSYKFDKISFYPAWQPWIYLLMVAWAGYRVVRMWQALLQKPYPSRPPAAAKPN